MATEKLTRPSFGTIEQAIAMPDLPVLFWGGLLKDFGDLCGKKSSGAQDFRSYSVGALKTRMSRRMKA